MTMTKTYTTPAAAIDYSLSHDVCARFRGNLADLLAYADEEGYETNQVRENDGSISVWGWTAQTPENEEDWRIIVELS